MYVKYFYAINIFNALLSYSLQISRPMKILRCNIISPSFEKTEWIGKTEFRNQSWLKNFFNYLHIILFTLWN